MSFLSPNLYGQEPYARRGEAQAVVEAASGGLPVGAITAYWGLTAPSGWLLCDGAAIPAQYTALIALVGANTPNLKGRVIVGLDAAQAEFNTLGETGGAKTVTLVEAQMPSHSHTTGNHDHGSVNLSHDHTGVTGADANHDHATVSASSLPAVVRSGGSALGLATPGDGLATYDTGRIGRTSTGSSHAHGVVGALGNHTHTAQAPSTDAKGSGSAHSNLQPYAAVPYIIKAA